MHPTNKPRQLLSQVLPPCWLKGYRSTIPTRRQWKDNCFPSRSTSRTASAAWAPIEQLDVIYMWRGHQRSSGGGTQASMMPDLHKSSELHFICTYPPFSHHLRPILLFYHPTVQCSAVRSIAVPNGFYTFNSSDIRLRLACPRSDVSKVSKVSKVSRLSKVSKVKDFYASSNHKQPAKVSIPNVHMSSLRQGARSGNCRYRRGGILGAPEQFCPHFSFHGGGGTQVSRHWGSTAKQNPFQVLTS